MIQSLQDSHKGVTYTKIESTIPVEGSLGFDTTKYVIKGTPSIETMERSYKYGDQIQLTVYNKQGTVQKRPRTLYAGTYDRLEIFFSKKDFIELCKKFLYGNNT